MSREYFGNAAHLVVSDSCRFHLATLVSGPAGKFLVSTVGDYVAPGDEKKPADERYTDIGWNRRLETFVFHANGSALCECGCGLPLPDDWSEIDSRGYNSRSEANAGHEDLCKQYESGVAA